MSPRPEPFGRGGPSPRRRWTDPCWVPGGIRIVVDHAALAAALGARLRDREGALALGVDPGALAARADVWRGARLGAAAAAGRAGPRGRDRDGDLSAVHRLVEGEPDLRLEVTAA